MYRKKLMIVLLPFGCGNAGKDGIMCSLNNKQEKNNNNKRTNRNNKQKQTSKGEKA